jgi:hypothetical protein
MSTKNNIINGAKILKKGVRDIATGAYTPCWYSFSKRIRPDGSTYEAAVIYARNYKPLPAGLQPINDSDSRTDYFEQDRAVFPFGTNEYNILAEVTGDLYASLKLREAKLAA